MTYYAGDAGVVLLLGPLSTGDVDGTDVTSVKLRAAGPRGSAIDTIELTATIASQSATGVTLRHETDGAMEAVGDWALRAFCYVDDELVASSTESPFTVSARRVSPP